MLPKGDSGEEDAGARHRGAVARLRRRTGLLALLPWRWDWVAARRSTAFRVCLWVGGLSAAVGLVALGFDLTHDDEYAASYVEDSAATTGTVTEVTAEKERVRKRLVARRGGAGQTLAEFDTFEEYRRVEYRFNDGRSDHSGSSRVDEDNKRPYREGDTVRIRYLPAGSARAETSSELDDEIRPRMVKIMVRRIAWQLLLGVPVLVIATIWVGGTVQERRTRRGTDLTSEPAASPAPEGARVVPGRRELVAVVAAHLALSLGLVEWGVLASFSSAGSLAYLVVFRLVLPVAAAAGLWGGRRWAWWALLGLFAYRALGELSAFVHYGRELELGWESWPVQKAGLLAAGYAALAVWVGLSAGLRRLSRSSGR